MKKDNFIEVYENVLSPKDCKYFIDVFEYCDSISVTHPGVTILKDGQLNGVDSDVKESTDLNLYPLFDDHMSELIQYLPPLYPEFPDVINEAETQLYNHLTKYLKKYMVVTNGFGEDSDEMLDYFYTNTLLMKRYRPPNEGYHKFHQDFNPRIDPVAHVHKRCLVCMFYLNDGETEWYHQGLKIKPTQGSLVIFPTYWTHHHKGHKPISNNKYILNSWVLYQ